MAGTLETAELKKYKRVKVTFFKTVGDCFIYIYSYISSAAVQPSKANQGRKMAAQSANPAMKFLKRGV